MIIDKIILRISEQKSIGCQKKTKVCQNVFLIHYTDIIHFATVDLIGFSLNFFGTNMGLI